MHIRVTPGNIQPDKMQQAQAIVSEIFDGYRQARGFQHGYLAANQQTGEGMVVTLWDSEEAAQAATQQGSHTLAKLGPLMVSGQTPVPPRAYEVLLEK